MQQEAKKVLFPSHFSSCNEVSMFFSCYSRKLERGGEREKKRERERERARTPAVAFGFRWRISFSGGFPYCSLTAESHLKIAENKKPHFCSNTHVLFSM